MKITNIKAVRICEAMIEFYDKQWFTSSSKIIVSRQIYRKIKRYNFLHKRNKFEPGGVEIVKCR